MRTALYRHFDADGVLLYVGISLSAVTRLSQHKEQSGWYASIARVEIEWFEDRETALRAETTAIMVELPKHNIRKKRIPLLPPPKPSPPEPVEEKPQYDTYIMPDGSYAYTIDGARERLAGISRSTIWRFMKEGRLQSIMCHGKKLITQQQLVDFINSCQLMGGPKENQNEDA